MRAYCATNKIETFDDRGQVHVGLLNNLGSRGRSLLPVLSERVEKFEFSRRRRRLSEKASKIATMTITSKRLSGLRLLMPAWMC